MYTKKIIALTILTLIVLATLVPHDVLAKSKQQKKIDAALKKLGWPNLCVVTATTKTNNVSQVVYDANCANNPGPNPNPNPTPDVIPKLNKTTTYRMAVLGDVDSNNGLVTQLNLLVKYQVQGLILPGDFEYTNGQGVLAKLVAAGFTKDNTYIVLGNHDKCKDITSWMGSAQCFGDMFFGEHKQIAVFGIDANSNFACGSSQYNQIKSDIESSDALYNIPAVHQPFVTVKSTHGPNGQFDCYQLLFTQNQVPLVLQAHNHNYQKEKVDTVTYGVYGTGTHDEGKKMYPCNSKTDQNGVPALCITGTNGVTILDFKIDDPHVKQIKGYFISNNDKIVDTFTVS